MSQQEDREILRNFWANQLPGEGFDKTKYEYHYEYTGSLGQYIWQAKCLGWEIVRGDMPENPSLRDEKGECRVGDVVLMRIPKERRQQIERALGALNRETLGEMDEEAVRRDIDDKMSRMLGHRVNLSFQFRDQRELNQRKRGE